MPSKLLRRLSTTFRRHHKKKHHITDAENGVAEVPPVPAVNGINGGHPVVKNERVNGNENGNERRNENIKGKGKGNEKGMVREIEKENIKEKEKEKEKEKQADRIQEGEEKESSPLAVAETKKRKESDKEKDKETDRDKDNVKGKDKETEREAYKEADKESARKSLDANTNLSEASTDRDSVVDTFQQFSQVLHTSQRPLPSQTGDATFIDEKPSGTVPEDMKNMGIHDLSALKDLIHGKGRGELKDDKAYLMERVIGLASALPENSKARFDLTNDFVDELWSSLQHPPISYLGDKFKFRQADGSYNNIMFPHLGAANTPYARSVQPMTIQSSPLPDPGLIFDSLFARGKFKKHPNNVSSLLFYWASLIVHDLFQTDHEDFGISKTSSYLDLSPLYGDTQKDQDQIRTFKDGRLKPDCFCEERMLVFPPGCGVLIIMFNRFHNYVVEQLALINEDGRFTKPSEYLPDEKAAKAWAKYDHDLFQTGRLITCGLYINITLVDYVRTILNLNRTNSTWSLDPRVDMQKVFTNEGTPRGIGNQVSAEFNMVYRWHSATSERDEAWTKDKFKSLFGKPAEDLSMHELLSGLSRHRKALDKDPHKRPFASLERQPDGKYRDDDLVNILADSIEDCAGAFGANNVPKALKALEVLSVIQGRKWGLATLNEFRKFFGLKPHETFESINPDQTVADQLRHLYAHPDYVELYPGIVAEDAKAPMVPGVGLAPTFTVSRAVLSDAVSLVRGDRFYTVDYHTKSLTNWGYHEVQYDLNIEQGCVFYKLFMRAFPNHFKPNSIYAHFPMTIPSENRKIMRDLGREDDYSFDRPAFIPPPVNVTSPVGAKFVLENEELFKITWDTAFSKLLGKSGDNLIMPGDTQLHNQQRNVMFNSLYREKWQSEVKLFYEHMTLKLLHEKSFKIAGINHVDITHDVGNLAHVHFAASVFSLPLKSKERPKGIFTEYELYTAMAAIAVCLFYDPDPVSSFSLHIVARRLAAVLGKLVEANVKSVSSSSSTTTGRAASVADSHHLKKEEDSHLSEHGVHMIKRLLDSGMGPEEVAWSQVLPAVIAMVSNQAQVFTQILDFYLSPPGSSHLPEINRLAKLNTPEAGNALIHYCMEGIRLNGTSSTQREATKTTMVHDGAINAVAKEAPVKKGDKVVVCLSSAGRDPVAFPDPDEVRLDRPLRSYVHYGAGPHQYLGMEASRVALGAMLKVVGKLDNLRRAPGPRGELKKIPRHDRLYDYLREDSQSFFPFPLAMQINWDGELPPLPAQEGH